LKVLDVIAPPRRLLAALAILLGGRDAAWLGRSGYRRGDARSLRVQTDEPFVLDGEIYDGGGGLTVTLAPSLRFLAS
jgi:hypothetical protein